MELVLPGVVGVHEVHEVDVVHEPLGLGIVPLQTQSRLPSCCTSRRAHFQSAVVLER